MTTRTAIGLALLGLGLLASVSKRDAQPPKPSPAPQPASSGIVLRGKFTTAEDAQLTEALFSEWADELEWDQMQPEAERHLTTGIAFDELRTRARDLRCRGRRIGDANPAARDAIAAYLTSRVGTSGGPLGQDQYAAWISALREIARAAADATR